MADDSTTPSSIISSSTKEFNKQLDERATRDEPINWADPWRMRKYCVTLLTTLKSLFVLRSNKGK